MASEVTSELEFQGMQIFMPHPRKKMNFLFETVYFCAFRMLLTALLIFCIGLRKTPPDNRK